MTEFELSFSPEIIERVMSEWEEENPGKNVREIGAEEFSRRMMIEINASIRRID